MDKIFKIGLLVLGVGYLVYCFYSLNLQGGQYTYRIAIDSNSNDKSPVVEVFDTRTGTMYISREDAIFKISPVADVLKKEKE
tara:strand:+ start:689 stop:934 length:246 start_codon:yes stop_codon:yes gene_type:complete